MSEPEFTLEQHLELLNTTAMRLYDVMSALLNKLDPDAWEYLSGLHEAGSLHNGFPVLNEDPWAHMEDDEG